VNIDISTRQNPLASVLSGQRPETGANARPAIQGAKRAVSISPAAQQLSSLQSGDADVNLARVNEIRSALAAGSLQIDTSRIADGLIDSARELLKEDVRRACDAG